MTIKEIENVLKALKKYCGKCYCYNCGLFKYCKYAPDELTSKDIKSTARKIREVIKNK